MTQIVNENFDLADVRSKLSEITGSEVPEFWKKLFPTQQKGSDKKEPSDGNS
jgi:hypothetical protein